MIMFYFDDIYHFDKSTGGSGMVSGFTKHVYIQFPKIRKSRPCALHKSRSNVGYVMPETRHKFNSHTVIMNHILFLSYVKLQLSLSIAGKNSTCAKI